MNTIDRLVAPSGNRSLVCSATGCAMSRVGDAHMGMSLEFQRLGSCHSQQPGTKANRR